MTILRRSSHAIGAVLLATLLVVGVAGCGGSSAPKVGDCIDAHNHVLDCHSAAATRRLVSDLKAPHAIACVQIGPSPQVEVRVDNHPFCAEKK